MIALPFHDFLSGDISASYCIGKLWAISWRTPWSNKPRCCPCGPNSSCNGMTMSHYPDILSILSWFHLWCSTCPLVLGCWGLSHMQYWSHDFSHAKKETTACKAEQILKMTTIFTQNCLRLSFWLIIVVILWICSTPSNYFLQNLRQNSRSVYLCLIFEMSIWEFITNLKKNRYRIKLDFFWVRTWFLLPV